MAGDWIKIRHALPRSGNVVRIMSACDADKLRTLGGLVSALLLFDEQTDCGHLSGYTLKAFDELIGLPGLGAALCDSKVGWMKQDEDGLTLLEWDKHNGSSAKRRANDAFRKSLTRAESASDNCPQNVRKTSAKKKTKCGPEKRREEKNIINTHTAREREEDEKDFALAGSVVIPPCTRAEMDVYAGLTGIPDEVCRDWYERHEAEDWRPRPGYLALTTKSWKLDLKNYWQNRKAKDDERRFNRRTTKKPGEAATGQVRINATNERNGFVDQETIDAYARKDRIKELADLITLWDSTKRWGTCTLLKEWNKDPLMPDAIKHIKENNEELFKSISQQRFIDEESGAWVGPISPEN